MMDNEILINQTQFFFFFLTLLKNTASLGTDLFGKS